MIHPEFGGRAHIELGGCWGGAGRQSRLQILVAGGVLVGRCILRLTLAHHDNFVVWHKGHFGAVFTAGK